MHRATGVILFFGSILFSSWVISASYGEKTFTIAQFLANSWFGQLVLFGLSLSLFYHLSNGIRHLFWDFGKGFELSSVQASGYFVLILTFILTFLMWVLVYTEVLGL